MVRWCAWVSPGLLFVFTLNRGVGIRRKSQLLLSGPRRDKVSLEPSWQVWELQGVCCSNLPHYQPLFLQATEGLLLGSPVFPNSTVNRTT